MTAPDDDAPFATPDVDVVAIGHAQTLKLSDLDAFVRDQLDSAASEKEEKEDGKIEYEVTVELPNGERYEVEVDKNGKVLEIEVDDDDKDDD